MKDKRENYFTILSLKWNSILIFNLTIKNGIFLCLPKALIMWVYPIRSNFQSLTIPFMQIPELSFTAYPIHFWLNDTFLVISPNISILACSFPSFLRIYILHFLSSIDSIFMTVSKCISLLGKNDGRMKRYDYVEYGAGFMWQAE